MFPFRPRLQLRTNAPRCREMVANAVTGTPIMILRLYAENLGLRSTDATCWIEHTYLDGHTIDGDRSQLNSWADTNQPIQTLTKDKHAYINLCQVQAENPTILFIRSIKGERGYNIPSPGSCTLTVSIEGRELHTRHEINVNISHEGSLDGLRFVSIDSQTRQLNWNALRLRSSLSRSRYDR
jgi:hypothetical protein